MSLRPRVEHNLKATKWYELDSAGNKVYKTGNSISAFSTYNFSNYQGNNSGNQYLPTNYTVFGFDDTCFEESVYKEAYRNVRDSLGTLIQVYLNNVSPSPPSYISSFAYGSVIDTRVNGLPDSLRVNYPRYYKETPGYYSAYINQVIGAAIRVSLYTEPVSFNGSAIAAFSGIGTLNPPEMIGIWERCDPKLLSVTPENGSFVDDTNNLNLSLSWDLATSYSGIRYEPTIIDFIWGISENSLTNTISLLNSTIIPANTFPKSTTIYWKIQWKSAAADETFETAVMSYSTTDAAPFVKPVSPVNASIDGSVDNIFIWSYTTDTGTTQKAFDLQISNDEGSTWATIFSHSETSETQAIIPADSFLAGTGMWRVRGYNTDNVASDWSSIATIIVRAAPQPPVISNVTRTPRITVSWQSTGQQAYQIIANDYDSGVIFGTRKTFTVPHYYMEGETVLVSVRIKNRFGEWSEPATITVQIANASPGTISAAADVQGANILLHWTPEGDFSRYYILRNQEIIGKTTGLSFFDYTAAGTNQYQIMGVDANNYYTLSNAISTAVQIENAVISNIETIEWIALAVKRGNIPEFSSEQAESITYQFYSGRILPIPYSSGFQTITRTLDFTVRLPELRKLRRLIGKIVIYKDHTGEKIIGILNDLQTSGRASRPDISMSITAIDYTEEIDLD